MPLRRVLCATDLSSRSRRAVGRAALLADRLNAQLVLLHVTEPDQMPYRSQNAREQIVQHLSSIGLPVSPAMMIEVRAGECIQTIASVAKETDADVIVLGSQRRKALAPLADLAAERITELAGRPALIVNREPRERYGAVVMAADMSDEFIRVVQAAVLLRFLEADSVSVVHGFESPHLDPLYTEGVDVWAAQRNIEEWERAAGARLRRRLHAAGVESSGFRLIFQQARPIRAIQHVIRSIQPDLLIVGANDRLMLNRVIRGSVADDTLRKVECDVLVGAHDGLNASRIGRNSRGALEEAACAAPPIRCRAADLAALKAPNRDAR